MKHFTITTQEQSEALRPYNVTPQDLIKVGHIITPSANEAYHTCWDDYPEDEAITFEECMSILKDEVTVDVWNKLKGSLKCGLSEIRVNENCRLMDVGEIVLNAPNYRIPNCTATKLRLLVAILRGE